jgi:hypothetical protein
MASRSLPAAPAAPLSRLGSLAKEGGLLASRGSDYHGPGESPYRPGTLPALAEHLTPVWSML